MKSLKAKNNRGRPVSSTDGAQEAFDYIEQYRNSRNLTVNALAVSFGMTPSTVMRALSNRSSARWTPTLKRLYSGAKKDRNMDSQALVVSRLAAYEGPGEPVVKRILADVEELIVALSHQRGHP